MKEFFKVIQKKEVEFMYFVTYEINEDINEEVQTFCTDNSIILINKKDF